MKTLTETVTSTHEITSYRCDHCDYTSDNEEDVLDHEHMKHAHMETIEWGTTIYTLNYLEDEAAFKRWVDFESRNQDTQVTRGGRFLGPGWYAWHLTHQPCPRRCCTDTVLNITKLDALREQWRMELLEYGHAYRELSKILKVKP